MPLTRQERKVIEELIKRSNELTAQLNQVTEELNKVIGMLNKMQLADSMNDWTIEQWSDFLKPIINDVIEKGAGSATGANGGSTIKIHNHKTEAEGGPAFAELGARLVE